MQLPSVVTSSQLRCLEKALQKLLPMSLQGRIVVSGFGSIYACMSAEQFDELRRMLECAAEPIWLEVPMEWGAGEVRICEVHIGRFFWYLKGGL